MQSAIPSWPALTLIAMLSGCDDTPSKPPAIGADLKLEESLQSTKWEPRLAERFPPGTAERRLIATLTLEGFTVDLNAREAAFQWNKGLCNYHLTAAWTLSTDGTIASTSGAYFPFCL